MACCASCFRQKAVLATRYGSLITAKKEYGRVYMDSSEFLSKVWHDYVGQLERMTASTFRLLIQDVLDYLVGLLQQQGETGTTYRKSVEKRDLGQVVDYWRGAPVKVMADAFYEALVRRYRNGGGKLLTRALFTTLPIVTLLEGIRWGKDVASLWNKEQMKISRHSTLFGGTLYVAVPVPPPVKASPATRSATPFSPGRSQLGASARVLVGESKQPHASRFSTDGPWGGGGGGGGAALTQMDDVELTVPGNKGGGIGIGAGKKTFPPEEPLAGGGGAGGTGAGGEAKKDHKRVVSLRLKPRVSSEC